MRPDLRRPFAMVSVAYALFILPSPRCRPVEDIHRFADEGAYFVGCSVWTLRIIELEVVVPLVSNFGNLHPSYFVPTQILKELTLALS